MSLLIALIASLFALAVPPAPAPPPPDPRIAAHAEIRTLVVGIQLIQRIRARTPADVLDGSCVDEKLAEARAGLQIASTELARLDDALAQRETSENDYALHRLSLLVERSGELTRAARVCATEERSTVDTTKVEVEISPTVPAGDPTGPPSSFQRLERPPEQ
jgi:hypothetical protein